MTAPEEGSRLQRSGILEAPSYPPALALGMCLCAAQAGFRAEDAGWAQPPLIPRRQEQLLQSSMCYPGPRPAARPLTTTLAPPLTPIAPLERELIRKEMFKVLKVEGKPGSWESSN